MERIINTNNYEASLKSRDTEETIDIWFYRPVGYCWALFFQRLGITPNVVTWMGIILGVAAAVCFYFNNIYINIAGMLLLIWANTYDSADGQLARMTGIKTRLGRLLDGLCGDIWFITIYVSLVLRMTPEWGVNIWILGAAAGYCHAKQASMGDYFRNLHLYFLKGKEGSELETSKNIETRYRKLTFRKDLIYKLFDFFYLAYTRGQERFTPVLQRLLEILKQRFPDDNPPIWLREEFRKRSLPLLKYTNILSFNTRTIALFLSLLFDIPWAYFVFELTVLNFLLVYMLYKYRIICSDLIVKLENEQAQ